MTSDRPVWERNALLSRIARGDGVPVSRAAGYGFAIALVVVALAIRLALLPPSAGLRYITFYPAIALAAMLLGPGPGMLAVALGAACVVGFFAPPHAESAAFTTVETASLAIFALSGALVCYLSHRLRRTVAASRASDLRFELLTASSFDGVALIEDGRIIACNDPLLAMLGYARGELVGTPIAEAVAAEDRDRAFAEVLGSDESPRELTMLRKDGGRIQVEGRGRTHRGDGRPLHIALLRDITERMRAERALRREAQKNLALLRSASDGIHVLDADGNLVEASDSFCDMLGYARDEIIGMHVSRWDARMGADEIAELMRQQFAQRTRTQFETRHRRKDGATIDVEISGHPLELDGRPVLFNSSRDITGRKAAEEELRIAAIAFDSQVGMIVTNAKGVIVRVNRAFTQLTGYDADEAIGRTPALLKSGRNDRAFYEQMWRRLAQTGYWQGEMWNRRKGGQVYVEWLTISAVKTPEGVTTHYVGTFSEITKNKEAEAEIHRLAYYDPLTHLPNRRLLHEQVRRVLAGSGRSHQHGALLFLDLDHFKNLNDTRGHTVGDQLLVETARRIQASVREDDTVARLGGDEFVVMIEGLSAQRQEAAVQARNVGEKLRESLARPYELVGRAFHCPASIGVTLFRGHEDSVETLLKHADLAMYQAKAAGRNALRFFDPAMQIALDRRSALEADLRLAVERGQFQLHFQPQVDRIGRVIGAEALLRWIHPERGNVMPGEFIALAEETDLILSIGQWVIEAACAQIRSWADGAATRDLRLAANVSARQFRQPDFTDRVRDALARAGADPRRLKFELTESVVINNVADTIERMQTLKTLGVGFAMDDFGTGFSSLSYLKRLPLDQLKIDSAFVRDLASDANDAAIVQTIITMGKTLGLEVIAEGVETPAQLQRLSEFGCVAYQGYLFARPMPLAQFEEYLLDQGATSNRRQ
jgi:diguanylate cyclase (GGDEF)-like protein/PAS domain S-box-containing protein